MPLISDDFSLEYRVIDLPGKRLGIVEALADNSHYMAAVHLLADSGATTIELEFSPDRDDRFSQLLGGEMVRDLALYLDRFASSAVEITSISELRAFNEGNTDLRAPYGQGLVDMMAELDLSAAELELIREQLQSAARAQLDQLFDESKLDVLLSVNNRHAGIAALANYPALTVPMGYAEDGRPIGLTLFAPPFREQDLIDIGAMYEQLSKARKPPPLPYQ
jgi:amidase